MNSRLILIINLTVAGIACLYIASILRAKQASHEPPVQFVLQSDPVPSSLNRQSEVRALELNAPISISGPFQILTGLPSLSNSKMLPGWVEDATVSQGTYVQKDNSARLIYPWAYESDAFDLRRDRPFDWFDDDDPREANQPRVILAGAAQ